MNHESPRHPAPPKAPVAAGAPGATRLDRLDERLDRVDRSLSRLEVRLDRDRDDLRRLVESLRRDQADLAGAVLARIDAHEEYHCANEHRWGLAKLAGRHPFRFAGLVAGAVAAGGFLRPEAAQRLAEALVRLAAGDAP